MIANRQGRRFRAFPGAGVVSVTLLAIGVTTGAAAAPLPDAGTQPTSGWGIDGPDGEVIPLIENTALPEAPEPADGQVTPYLIDYGEYVSCWTLGMEGLNFANYPFAWDGEMQNITLLCGTSVYGYRHIANGHENEWADVLTAANDTSGDSWDDLMSFANYAVLNDSYQLYGPNSKNKMCGTSYVNWYPNGYDHPATYGQRVLTVWSANNRTIITSYPITGGSSGCLNEGF